jgi:Ferredoxin subunits of nitrite reductase and ring-hydroxylating dioxygenases
MGNLTNATRVAIAGIGRWRPLDRLSSPLSAWVSKTTRPTTIKNALSGTWLGHQLHPALTDVPIGAWAAATVLDLTAGKEGAAAARRLVGLGILAAVPTAAAGASDWADTYGAEQRVGLVHAAANSCATAMQLASWVARRRGRRDVGVLLSFLALGVSAGAAYLGGHLSLGRGVGVNHTAFQDSVADWTDVAAESDVKDATPLRVTAAGVPVVLVRQKGRVRALSAVCTHAGGPLDQGTLDDAGCLKCPWHGSEFRLADGIVQRGPATVPEPSWDVKAAAGRVLVRSR